MKKILALATVVGLTTSLWADSQNIHRWVAEPVAEWRTHIKLTNACNQDSVEAILKFWNSDGTLLANKQISSSDSTSASGEIILSLSPHQTKGVLFDFNYFPAYEHGSGIVTAKTASGVKCLTGAYVHESSKANANGKALGYRFNNGENF
jgi:hypothetical protein